MSTNTVFLSSGTIFGITDVLETQLYGVVTMKIKSMPHNDGCKKNVLLMPS